MSSEQPQEQSEGLFSHQGRFAFRSNKNVLCWQVRGLISYIDPYHLVIDQHFSKWADDAVDEATINYIVDNFDVMPSRLQLYLQRLANNDPDFQIHPQYPTPTGFFGSDEFFGRPSPH